MIFSQPCLTSHPTWIFYSVLVYLDLAATSDTIDHFILLNRLQASFGLDGRGLQWISFYLSNRSHFDQFGWSTWISDVPQGSVFGPILFIVFISHVSIIASSHTVSNQQYADETIINCNVTHRLPDQFPQLVFLVLVSTQWKGIKFWQIWWYSSWYISTKIISWTHRLRWCRMHLSCFLQ